MYDDADRGMIRNKARAGQFNDFRGLRWGKITPTDTDGFLDFQDKLFVWIEVKCRGAAMSEGQRKSLERRCDACQKDKRASYVLVATHNCPVDEDINVAVLSVLKYRHKGKWRKPKSDITMREAIEKMRAKHLEGR